MAIAVIMQQMQQQQYSSSYAALTAPMTNEQKQLKASIATGTHAATLGGTGKVKAAAAAATTNYKTRLRKRHNSFQESYRREMRTFGDIEWSNPCGGVWQEEIAKQLRERERQRQLRKRSKRCAQYRKILRILQNNTGREYRSLRDEHVRARHSSSSSSGSTATPAVASDAASMPMPAIDISKMRIWSLHNGTYKFLPALELNSNIALKRWHRQLQTYIAAFAYMRRIQLHWDYNNTMQESPIAAELLRLKQSARMMLCYVETAINGTQIVYGRRLQTAMDAGAVMSTSGGSGAEAKTIGGSIRTMPRQFMENKLKNFKTPIMRLHAITNTTTTTAMNVDAASGAVAEELQANSIDVKFLKYYYIHYLRNMAQLLRKHATKHCPGSSSSSSSSNTKTATAHSAGNAVAVTPLITVHQHQKNQQRHKKLNNNNNNNNDINKSLPTSRHKAQSRKGVVQVKHNVSA